MDPILDIRRVRADLFTYSLRVPGQAPRLVDDFFGSADRCLHDAAEALSNYFESVEVQWAGEARGTVALEQLRCPVRRQQILMQMAAC